MGDPSRGLGLRGVWRAFDGGPVLEGVDIAAEPGGVYGLLGPNGSGKSTALRILAGVLAPDRGEVTDARDAPHALGRTAIGFVPQHPALYPSLTCEETLRFFGAVHGVPRSRLESQVERVVDAVGLAPSRRVCARALSGGWRQILSLASALVHEPALLVLDEPTNGLDVRARQLLWQVIHGVAERGVAVVLSTHSLEEAERHCSTVGILRGGRVAVSGTPAELSDLVPAVQIAEVELDDPALLLDRVGEEGWTVRPRRNRWCIWLASVTTLPELAQEFAGLPLRSMSLRPVTLGDVFVEVTRTTPYGGS